MAALIQLGRGPRLIWSCARSALHRERCAESLCMDLPSRCHLELACLCITWKGPYRRQASQHATYTSFSPPPNRCTSARERSSATPHGSGHNDSCKQQAHRTAKNCHPSQKQSFTQHHRCGTRKLIVWYHSNHKNLKQTRSLTQTSLDE